MVRGRRTGIYGGTSAELMRYLLIGGAEDRADNKTANRTALEKLDEKV